MPRAGRIAKARGLVNALAGLDKDRAPGAEGSASKRSELAQALGIDGLMAKNKLAGQPFDSMLEVMTDYMVHRKRNLAAVKVDGGGRPMSPGSSAPASPAPSPAKPRLRSSGYTGRLIDGLRAKALAAVTKNGRHLEWDYMQFAGDREIVAAACANHGEALSAASDELKADRDVVLAAVRQDGYTLEHADVSMRNNKEVVMAAVLECGEALEHASEAMRRDPEVVLAAARQHRNALDYALVDVTAALASGGGGASEGDRGGGTAESGSKWRAKREDPTI